MLPCFRSVTEATFVSRLWGLVLSWEYSPLIGASISFATDLGFFFPRPRRHEATFYRPLLCPSLGDVVRAPKRSSGPYFMRNTLSP